ncbi:MAG: ParB/RepB/Spo0J family partition protein [Candidatus Methylopumilus sp.]|jgi:ParB family transcriptional regulator, chromosome partitioning protein|nr:ParB/RepB/Spo0J family partition protein [Candidatus Methylopumilus sp.]NBW61211.1 ParB/RepB/Spo0J family partition protein [Methylophilaceae bacterium]
MSKNKGLGRGLDALLSGEIEESSSADQLKTMPVTALQPGKYQPRTFMDPASLESLAESIRAQGIMQPIVVRKVSQDRYEIIAGERRWRAAQLAGLTQVPVIIREIPDEAALAMALIENIQREDLNPIEEAHGLQKLMDEFAMTHEVIAKAVGRSRSAVSNTLRLLNLHAKVQDLLLSNQLDMGHARALLSLQGAEQVALANEIVLNKLTVRDAESLAKRAQQKAGTKSSVTKKSRDLLTLQESLSEKLGFSVSLDCNAKGAGTMKIRFSNLDQLDEIIKKF